MRVITLTPHPGSDRGTFSTLEGSEIYQPFCPLRTPDRARQEDLHARSTDSCSLHRLDPGLCDGGVRPHRHQPERDGTPPLQPRASLRRHGESGGAFRGADDVGGRPSSLLRGVGCRRNARLRIPRGPLRNRQGPRALGRGGRPGRRRLHDAGRSPRSAAHGPEPGSEPGAGSGRPRGFRLPPRRKIPW